MRKTALCAIVGLALLSAPFVASAQTVSSLQSELSSLLAQLQSLEGQGSVSGSASVSGNAAVSPANPMMPVCPVITRSLSVGSTGSDVTALQQFLSSQGDLSVSATGYFGSLTKAGVQKWQAQAGVAAQGGVGSGIFGPMSRSYLSRSCGGGNGSGNGSGQQSLQSFSADPQSGAAPLFVTFTTNDSMNSSSTYSVDFGDGTTTAMTEGDCVGITAVADNQGGVQCSFSVTHIYAQNGTYTAKLMKETPPPACTAGYMCPMYVLAPQVVATTVITVGSSTTTQGNVDLTATPSSGLAPLTVQFEETAPQGMTLGTTINFGDGSSGTLGVVPVCSSCNAEAVATHTYTSSGTYNASVTSGMCSCPANGICNCPNMMILASATVTVTNSNSGGDGSGSSAIQQLNAPGTVTLAQSGIAEIRNESYYFTLQSLTASSATIQLTQVGCWNSFPSDSPPHVICMIAVVPIPPQTLSIGQSYVSGNYDITLSNIANSEATFSITAPSTQTN